MGVVDMFDENGLNVLKTGRSQALMFLVEIVRWRKAVVQRSIENNLNVVVERMLRRKVIPLFSSDVDVLVRTEEKKFLVTALKIGEGLTPLTDETVETAEMIGVHVRNVGEANTRENRIGLIAVEMSNLSARSFGTFEQKERLFVEMEENAAGVARFARTGRSGAEKDDLRISEREVLKWRNDPNEVLLRSRLPQTLQLVLRAVERLFEFFVGENQIDVVLRL